LEEVRALAIAEIYSLIEDLVGFSKAGCMVLASYRSVTRLKRQFNGGSIYEEEGVRRWTIGTTRLR
jgi:hypothetical protein